MSAQPQKLPIRHYAIGDFAQKTGVSTHFLKFYEEKGILRPKVKENGYRYYNIQDASVVLECRRMKNMGFSVKRIEKGIKDCTAQEVGDAIDRQEKELEAQLHMQKMHLLGLQNLREALRFCEQGEWSVRTVPDIWFLPHTMNREFVPDDRIYDQLPEWLDWMPMTISAQVVRYSPEGELQAEWGLGLEQSEAEMIGFAPREPARLVRQGRVLEIYGSWPARDGDEPWVYELCRERARQLNLIPGDTVFRRLFCYTEKDGVIMAHCALRVPVRLPE